MTFEWDENKNLANIEKHGVSFEESKLAFLDPKRKIRMNPTASAFPEACFGVSERISKFLFP
jgi:hypothetical protein